MRDDINNWPALEERSSRYRTLDRPVTLPTREGHSGRKQWARSNRGPTDSWSLKKRLRDDTHREVCIGDEAHPATTERITDHVRAIQANGPGPRLETTRHLSHTVSLSDMANTVTVHDPRTDSEYQATRRQAERLHIPAGCTIIRDENGDAVKKPRKPKPDTSATTEE